MSDIDSTCGRALDVLVAQRVMAEVCAAILERLVLAGDAARQALGRPQA